MLDAGKITKNKDGDEFMDLILNSTTTDNLHKIKLLNQANDFLIFQPNKNIVYQ